MAHNLTTKTIYHTDTSGINTDDVAAVLGVGSHDVGTLCSHPSINMWAKYKPIRLADSEEKPWADLKQNNNWKGKDENCGILCNTTTKVTEVATYPNAWQKTDVPLDWYRITDFDGYDGKAHPIDSLCISNGHMAWILRGTTGPDNQSHQEVMEGIEETEVLMAPSLSMNIEFQPHIQSTDGTVPLSAVKPVGSLTALDAWYMGVVRYKTISPLEYIDAWSAQQTGTSSLTFEGSAASGNTTEYLVPAFFSTKQEKGANVSARTYCRLPGIPRIKVRWTTVAAACGIECKLKAQISGTRVMWELVITNNSSVPYNTRYLSFDQFTVGVYHTAALNATAAATETLTNFTVNSKTSVTKSGSIPFTGTTPQYIRLTNINLLHNTSTGIGLDFKTM